MKNTLNSIAKRTGAIAIMLCLVFAFIPFAGGGSYAKSVKLSKKTLYLAEGSSYKLKVSGTKAKVTWSSSDETVATVSSKGKVKAVGLGECTVTALVKGKTLSCKVIVLTKAAYTGRSKAIKLRNYVIKHGKKGSSQYNLQKTKKTDENEGTVEKWEISASKSDYKLVFRYSIRTEEPPEARTTQMTIDLISGAASIKEGTFFDNVHEEYSEESDSEYLGMITTEFHNGLDEESASVTGMELTSYTLYRDDGSVSEQIKDLATLNTGETYLRAPSAHLQWSFDDWNNFMKGFKTLKKAKITMKSLGFTDYELK